MRKQSKGTLQFTTFRKKIVLEPELEQMFQDCQRELDAARTGRYDPEGNAKIMARHVLGDDIYARQVRMPKWSKTVSMLEEPKVAIRHALDWGIPHLGRVPRSLPRGREAEAPVPEQRKKPGERRRTPPRIPLHDPLPPLPIEGTPCTSTSSET